MEDEKTPLISVVMGVLYRRDDLSLLQRAVESVLGQSLGDFELLICDDGSTAEARQYLEEQARSDRRIRLLWGCQRTDLAAKLNFCLREARGAYIARMDDDDRSLPERFEKQLAFLRQNPDAAFVGSWAELIREGERIGVRRLPERPAVEDFYMTQPFLHPALVFRREALEAVGGYCEEKRCFGCEDYDLLLRLHEAGYAGANIQEPLLEYTVSDGSGRKMRHRLNEAKTRYSCFKALGKLPGAWPYVIKPLAVGLLPPYFREQIKRKRWENGGY